MELYRSRSQFSRKTVAGGVLIALALITLAAVPLWAVNEGSGMDMVMVL